MKEKLFKIIGSSTSVEANSLFDPEVLSAFTKEVILIGDYDNGFDIISLKKAFDKSLDESDKVINIILYTHGYISSNGGFFVITNIDKEGLTQSVHGKILLDCISKGAKGRAVNIITIACHAEALSEHIVENMRLITLSDHNKFGYFNHINLSNINYTYYFKTNLHEGFNIIDNILRAYCYALGKYTTSSAKISFIKNGEKHTYKITDFVPKFIESKSDFTPLFKSILQKNSKLMPHIKYIFEQIKNGKNIEEFNSCNLAPYCSGDKLLPCTKEDELDFYGKDIFYAEKFITIFDKVNKFTSRIDKENDDDKTPIASLKEIKAKLQSMSSLPEEPDLTEQLNIFLKKDNPGSKEVIELLTTKKQLLLQEEELNNKIESIINFV